MRHLTPNFRLFVLSLFSLILSMAAGFYWMRQIQKEVHSLDLMSRGVATISAKPDLSDLKPNLLQSIFTANTSFHLRDDKLGNPVSIDKGATITLDPEFSKQVFGTDKPTIEQVQQLMLNPSKKMRPEIFRQVGTNRKLPDYFFPVQVKTKKGEIKQGKMALQSYVRSRSVTIAYESEKIRELQDNQVPAYTRAQGSTVAPTDGSTGCLPCEASENRTKEQKDREFAQNLVEKIQANVNPLWSGYLDYAREFSAANPKVNIKNVRDLRSTFIKGLVGKFGPQDAGKIIAAITAYAEAPDQHTYKDQIGEVAGVLRTLNNRAREHYRTDRSYILRNAGITTDQDALLSASLHDSQYAVWSDKDINLQKILSFNPDDKRQAGATRRLAYAFEAQRKIDNNEIEFIGDLGRPDAFHYHAKGETYFWSIPKKKIPSPKMKIKITDVQGMEHIVMADLTNSPHVFYKGPL